MYKRILSCILCICLVFTACSRGREVVNEKPPELPDTMPSEDRFELAAVEYDKYGIGSSSSFKLTSKDGINKSYVEKNLKIAPESGFKIEELSSTEYNVIPLSDFKYDEIYQFTLKDESYEYSWAFQTRKQFGVESTLPADAGEYVPVNSGIEIYFTQGNLAGIDDYFEIMPKVDGKFIYKDNAAIFVPSQLDMNTIYTVTVKKGYGPAGGEEKLQEDYKFTFKTQSERSAEIYFNRAVINIHESNVKIIDAYVGKEQEYNINIYQYDDVGKFTDDVSFYAETGKFPETGDNDRLALMSSLSQRPHMQETPTYLNALFELPEELKKGYYLLEFDGDGLAQKQYLFLQINDILVYYGIFENGMLVFAGEGLTGGGIEDAQVILNGRMAGYTNEKGVLVLDEIPSDEKAIKLTVRAKGYNDFIYGESFFINDYYYRYNYGSYDYYRYIDTDRPVYLPTDTINVWGFAKHRDKKSVGEARLELYDGDLVLETKTVKLTDIGTYQASFEISNITAEWLGIRVYDNETLISVTGVSIREYTKPLFTLKGSMDKKFAYSGEEVNYKINSSFFDGSPMPGLDLRIKTNAYNNVLRYNPLDTSVRTDENGNYSFSFDTNVVSDDWRPVEVYADAFNDKAEDAHVYTRNTIKIFPKHRMLEMEQNEENLKSISILLHELSLENYDPDNGYDYKQLRGKPVDDTINVRIIERYNEKVVVGEEYDFINKVNVVKYDYKRIENTVYDQNVSTEGGISFIEIPDFRDDRNYEIIAFNEDGNGGIKETLSAFSRRYSYYDGYYTLEKVDSGKTYRLNAPVNLQLKYMGEDIEELENDSLLIIYMRNGIADYDVYDTTRVQTVFSENYIPNTQLYAVYIKNGYLYLALPNESLIYDRTERKLNIELTTDRKEYRPGEEVEVKVRVSDEYGRPQVADVNISVVDEAYFAAVYSEEVDTLRGLYGYSWNGGMIKSYLSNIDLSEKNSFAEKGGGGGEDGEFRDDFKDANVFKTITTGSDGRASMKFTLADNLTSWRITYQAITEKLYAGSGTANISSSLPFFTDLIMGKKYLSEDKIEASLRVFGTAVKQGENIEYIVAVRNKDNDKKTEYKSSGKAGDYTNISMGKLSEGSYEIYVTAKSGSSQDKIMEEFSVVDSYVYFQNTGYYKISESTVLDRVYSNPVITLYNESTSDFYNSLRAVSSSDGRRIDQTAVSMIAAKYINSLFGTELYYDEDELLNTIFRYEDKEGGLRLLTYSERDAELTAKMVHIFNNSYLDEKMKKYFKNILSNDEFSTDTAAALWGMSKYRQPVLVAIYDLLENQDLSERDTIYLSLALAELGDGKTARKHYRELSGRLNASEDYLYCGEGSTNENDYELTALLALLASELQDFDKGDKMFKYIYNNPSKYTLSSIEQLKYIMNRDIMSLKEVQNLYGEVTVETGDSKKTYKLKLFDIESFTVKKDEITRVVFSGIKGDIACKVEALGNKDDLYKNKTDEFSISVDYMLENAYEKKKSFNHSDVVRVVINTNISIVAESGMYEVTYVIPSGFRYMYDGKNYAWGEVNGQKLVYRFYYDKERPNVFPIEFYMQAAQKGEYTVDYAVIKRYFENKLNYVERTVVSVN